MWNVCVFEILDKVASQSLREKVERIVSIGLGFWK